MKHIFHTDEVHREWAYSAMLEDHPAVKRLHRFLLDHKEDECVLYHGTHSSIPVLSEGLKPTSASRRRSLQSGSGYVYLSVYPGMARTFGEMAYSTKDVRVYAVSIKISELRADKDQLRNMRHFGMNTISKDTLACSLAIGHAARVKRHIWPYEIVEFIDPTESR